MAITNREVTTGYWGVLSDENGIQSKCLAVPRDDGFACIVLVQWANGTVLDYLMNHAPDNTGIVFILVGCDDVVCDTTPLEIEVTQRIEPHFADSERRDYFPIVRVNGKIIFGTRQATINELSE